MNLNAKILIIVKSVEINKAGPCLFKTECKVTGFVLGQSLDMYEATIPVTEEIARKIDLVGCRKVRPQLSINIELFQE